MPSKTYIADAKNTGQSVAFVIKGNSFNGKCERTTYCIIIHNPRRRKKMVDFFFVHLFDSLPTILITLAASENGARTFKLLIMENPMISISIIN